MKGRKKEEWKSWKHITKLDPDKDLTLEDIETIKWSGTDAIMISGTQKINERKVSRLISLVKEFEIPKILEPVTPRAIPDEDVDYLFVPIVLNTSDPKWIVGMHKDWILNYKIDWEKVIPEAYIIMNPESAVAKLTKSRTDLTTEEVIAYAQYAEKYLKLPIVYLEYSGMYGDPRLVERLSESLIEASLFYGGGIDSQMKAAEMKRYADVIVVGNVVYTEMSKFVETVR